MTTIAVIDYGMGNLRSVAKALEHVTDRHEVIVTNDLKAIEAAERIVFPGQGAIGHAMENMNALNLVEELKKVVQEKPFLGICLGLQALMTHSDEDNGVDALGIVPGQVHHFRDFFRANKVGEHLKIPHMGWNQVRQAIDHPLWQGIEDNSRFYFVHSFYVAPDEAAVVSGMTDYGGDFAAAVAHDNLFAVQFHPEKSQNAGLQLLKNFVNWNI